MSFLKGSAMNPQVFNPVNWGILSTAQIGVETVIPAMQKGRLSRIIAIASRDGEKARRVADKLGIPKAYGSYEELLADPEVEAIYNPLPHHMHVPWSAKAAEAGKHVLCEKPIAVTRKEAEKLIEVRDETRVQIQEAFVFHSILKRELEWLARTNGFGEQVPLNRELVHCVKHLFSRAGCGGRATAVVDKDPAGAIRRRAKGDFEFDSPLCSEDLHGLKRHQLRGANETCLSGRKLQDRARQSINLHNGVTVN